jgi:phosphatidylserine/phosphatidylglycerophosphate/cardiolipin synthase-like enzyme
MRNRWLIPALLFMIVVASVVLAANRIDLVHLSGTSSGTACLDSLETVPSVTTGVLVEPDDGYATLLAELDHARCEIALSIYLLSDDVVLQSLAAAHARGVNVRVQLEEDPFGGGFGSAETTTEFLETAGIPWRWTPSRFNFSHAKYMVIDRQVAIIMNMNLTASAFNSNREFAVMTTDPAVVDETYRVFDADWRDVPLQGALRHVVTSPENSRQTMIGLIDAAQDSIDLYAEVIRDDAFIAALSNAARRGVSVRLIVNESSDPLDQDVYARLAAAGIDIRFSGRLYIHAKAMMFDGRQAFIGSQNPTANSFDNNREIGMIVDDPISLSRCASVFAREWLTGIPASAE